MRKLTLISTLFSFLLAQSQNVAVQLTEMNLVYKGIDNPVNIAVEGVKNEDLIIATSEYLTYANGNLRVEEELNGEGFVYVGKKENQDTVWLDTVKLRIRSLPQPTAQLGGIPNDGLPKERASVQAQTSLLATMGAGFAYNLHYEVTYFKFIIAYANKPPLMFSGSGSALTSRIRKALLTLEAGDNILIEGIRAEEKRYGFKAELSPILIKIWADNSLYWKAPTHFNYARLLTEGDSTMLYSYNSFEIAEWTDTVKNGILDIFSLGPQGHLRISSSYKSGKELTRIKFNDYNQLVSIQHRLDSNSWKYISYYPNNQIKIETSYTENEVLQGTEEFSDCYDGKRWSDRNLYFHESCADDSSLMDLFNLFINDEIAATQSFKSYYENGQLKIEGNLVLDVGLEESDSSWCGTGDTYFTYRNSTVLDGKWKFYSEDGKLKETRKYDKGKRVK